VELLKQFRRWDSKYDEWISRESSRVRPFGRLKNINKRGLRFTTDSFHTTPDLSRQNSSGMRFYN